MGRKRRGARIEVIERITAYRIVKMLQRRGRWRRVQCMMIGRIRNVRQPFVRGRNEWLDWETKWTTLPVPVRWVVG